MTVEIPKILMADTFTKITIFIIREHCKIDACKYAKLILIPRCLHHGKNTNISH